MPLGSSANSPSLLIHVVDLDLDEVLKLGHLEHAARRLVFLRQQEMTQCALASEPCSRIE